MLAYSWLLTSGFAIIHTCNIARTILQRKCNEMSKDTLQLKQISQEINYNGILKSARATSGASCVFFLLPLVENTTDPAITDVNFPRLPKHVQMQRTKDDL